MCPKCLARQHSAASFRAAQQSNIVKHEHSACCPIAPCERHLGELLAGHAAPESMQDTKLHGGAPMIPKANISRHMFWSSSFWPHYASPRTNSLAQFASTGALVATRFLHQPPGVFRHVNPPAVTHALDSRLRARLDRNHFRKTLDIRQHSSRTSRARGDF